MGACTSSTSDTVHSVKKSKYAVIQYNSPGIPTKEQSESKFIEKPAPEPAFIFAGQYSFEEQKVSMMFFDFKINKDDGSFSASGSD